MFPFIFQLVFSPITRAPLEVERSCHMREEKIKLDKYTWISMYEYLFNQEAI